MKYNSITEYLTVGIAILIAILLLSNTLIPDTLRIGPINPSRTNWFYHAVGTASVLCAVGIWFRKTTFRFTPTDACIALYATYVWLNYHLSGSTASTSMEILTLLCITYFLFRLLCSTHPAIHHLCILLLLSIGTIQAIWGLLQLYGFSASNHALYRFTGSFFNPGPYCGLLATLLPLALNNILKKENKINHIAAILCFITICTILPAGMSRSAWLAAISGCAIIISVKYRPYKQIKQYSHQHKRLFILYLSLFPLLLSCAGYGIYQLKKDSADGRLLMWKISTQIIKIHPVTGVGTGGFSGAYGNAQAHYFAENKATPQEEYVAGAPEYGFNEYLQITTEQGIIGLLLFLSIVASAIREAWRNRHTGILASLLAFLTFAAFSYPFSLLPLCTIFVLLLALCPDYHPHHQAPTPSSRQTKGLYLLFILPAILFLLNQRQKQKAYDSWIEEQKYFNMNIFEGTVDNYRKLYPQLKEYGTFLFEYGQSLAQTGQYEESNRILQQGTLLSADPMFHNLIGKNYQALKQYPAAEIAFQRAHYTIPHRLYPLYLLALLYTESGQQDKAIAIARKAIDKEPKIISSAIREMKQKLQTEILNNNRLLIQENQ